MISWENPLTFKLNFNVISTEIKSQILKNISMLDFLLWFSRIEYSAHKDILYFMTFFFIMKYFLLSNFTIWIEIFIATKVMSQQSTWCFFTIYGMGYLFLAFVKIWLPVALENNYILVLSPLKPEPSESWDVQNSLLSLFCVWSSRESVQAVTDAQGGCE